jgi:hypothetical protein
LTPPSSIIEKVLGVDLDALSRDLTTWATRQFDTEKGGIEQSKAFRSNTPIRYFEVCGTEVLAQVK